MDGGGGMLLRSSNFDGWLWLQQELWSVPSVGWMDGSRAKRTKAKEAGATSRRRRRRHEEVSEAQK